MNDRGNNIKKYLLNSINRIKGVPPDRLPNKEEKKLLKKAVSQYGSNFQVDQLWHETKLVVFDVETTGFHAYHGDEIISISGVFIEDGKINYNKTFDQIVNPGRNIPSVVTELTGITEAMVLGKPNIYSALVDFFEFAGNTVLVAHNARFDTAFINLKLKTCSNAKLYHPVLDTSAMVGILYPALRNQRFDDLEGLDRLCAMHNIPIENRHTSLGDSIMTAKLFLQFVNKMTDRKLLNCRELLSEIRAYQSLSNMNSPFSTL
jgi:DNA polymerase III subunit epsilon